MQDHRGFEHLDHEGGLAAGDIVRGPDPGEKFVEESEPDLVSRHERANLGHQYNEGRLAEKGGFSGHVRTGQHDNLLAVLVQINVIRHIFLSRFHQCLNDRVASRLDAQGMAPVNLRPAIMPLQCLLRKACQHVNAGKRKSIDLDGTDE